MRIIAFAFAASIVLASTAHGQIVRTGSTLDKSFDIGVSLALNGINKVNAQPLCEELAFPCTGGGGLAPGVAISWAGNIGDFFALILDGGVYRERWEAPAGQRAADGGQRTNTIISVGIGPRIYLPGWNERTRVFGQFLWGARMSNEVEGSNAWTPGAGVDIRFPSRVSLRFEVDYAIMRGAPPGPRSIGGTRMLAGVAIPIGPR